MNTILRFWRVIVWAMFACGVIWVLAFEQENPHSRRWLIALTIGAAAFFLATVVLGLRDHRRKEQEMDAVDELMGSKEKQPFDRGD